MPNVIACVVTYNRAKMLAEAVEALFRQSVPLTAVVVVDNASRDETPAVLEELTARFGASRLRVVRHATNEGSAGGYRKALMTAYDMGAEWLWTLDDDTLPKEDALERLLECPRAKEPSTGALGCLNIEVDGSIIPQCRVDRESFEFNPVVPAGTQAEAFLASSPEPLAIDTNAFDGMFVHRRALDKVGFPDRALFLWYDDIEFSLRISRHLKMWLVPGSWMYHRSRASSTDQHVKPFRAPVAVYAWEDLWRQYYRSRNYYYVCRRNSSPLTFHKRVAKGLLRELLVPALLGQSHLESRARIVLKAAWDGYWGRLGRSVKLEPPFGSAED